MKADRETLALTAKRSIPPSTSEDKVSETFTFRIAIITWFIGRFDRSPTGRYPLICPRMARASAAGSAASVIGLPTTMWLAPEAMASAGVTMRT